MVHVTPLEKELVNSVIRFANLKVKSTVQVEEIFRKLPLSPVFKIIQPGEEAAYCNDQTELRQWLTEIAERGGAARKSIGEKVSERLGAVDTRVTFNEGGLSYQVAVSGVQAAYAYAIALLLDKSRGIASRLGFCKAPGCGKFRVTWAGRPRQYCNNNHRILYDSLDAKDRMKAYRKRLKKKAREREVL